MPRPLLTAAALAAAVAVGVTSVAVLTGSGRAHSTQTVQYVSPSGSDSNKCTTRASPCQTFNAAYETAAPGGTVYVESGTYPSQTIKWDGTKNSTACDGYDRPTQTSGCVTIQPDAGATVTFQPQSGIQINGSDVLLKGFDLGTGNLGGGVNINQGGCTGHTPSYIVLMNDRGSLLGIDGPASYIADISGYWSAGDSTMGGNADALREYPCDGDNPGPDHTRFSGGFYGDVIQAQLGQHLACVHLTDATYVTMDRSKMTNCAQHDIEIEETRITGTGFLIENNLLGALCSAQTSVDVGGVCKAANNIDVGLGFACGTGTQKDMTIRFNSVDGTIAFNCGSTASPGIKVYGNIVQGGIDGFHCSTYQQWGVNYYDDVFLPNYGPNSQTCGAGSVMTSVPQLANPASPGYDFHLASRTVKAVGRVPAKVPGGYPAVDYSGTPRPVRSAIDAGAYQWETPLLLLGRTLGGISIGQPVAKITAVYGTPRTHGRRSFGKKSVDVLAYRLHGGQVVVYADRGSVVGIGTSSPYYTSPSGIGIGTSMGPVLKWAGITWVPCRLAWTRRLRGADVFVVPAGGKKNGPKIAGLTMMKAGYDYGSCGS